ncbi:MAG: hypothetical protein R3C25_04585 [Hyphomonadaceae bacterium]
MRAIAALALILAVSLGVCERRAAEEGFSPDYRLNFVNACQAQGSGPEMCACAWDRIEAEVSRRDFDALERLPGPQRDADPLTARINQYVQACAAQFAPVPDPESPPAP